MLTALAAGVVLCPAASDAAAPPAGLPTVTEDMPVTSNYLPKPRAQNSPLIAAEPADPRFVVLANRLDAPDFGCALHLSSDRGHTWIPANPVPKLPKGAKKCYAPEAAFARQGVLYYLFVGLAGRGNEPMGVFLTTSKDRGRTFSTPRRVLGRFNFSVRMAVDRSRGGTGRIHLVWLKANSDPGLGSLPPPPNPILASHSDDGGETFSTPIQVSDPKRELVAAPALALGRDGAVHVLYHDLGRDRRDYHGLEGPTYEGKWSLVLSSSSDRGRHFERGVVVDDDLTPPERVMLIFTMAPASLATDKSGAVFVAWHDARNGDWDVFLRRSRDRGRSWEDPVGLNDDARRNERHQYLPKLSVAPDGRVDAIFYDRRNDRHNRRKDVYYTFSRDGGRSFSPNLRLTSRRSDSAIGQRYIGPAARGLVEFGSRLGLLSFEDKAVAAWTDTRSALVPPYQDIFATEVRFKAGEQSNSGISALAWLGAAGLLAAALVALRIARRRRGPQVLPEPGAQEGAEANP